MYHTAAQQLYPAAVAEYVAALFLAERALYGKFKTWLGEREIKRLSFNFQALAVIFLEESL
jgi:hypothetical protein